MPRAGGRAGGPDSDRPGPGSDFKLGQTRRRCSARAVAVICHSTAKGPLMRTELPSMFHLFAGKDFWVASD